MLRTLATRGIGLTSILAILGSFIIGAALLGPMQTHAQDSGDTSGALSASELLPSEFGETTGLGTQDLQSSVASIIRAVLAFLGVVAVVIVLLGGFKWMTAGGNDDKVQEAKRLLIAGVIGLAIILTAYAITSFVIGALLSATQE